MPRRPAVRISATLRTAKELLSRQLEDPKFREEWNRTALARAVSLRLVGYRADNGLSQTQLAERIGIKQPAVARLEAGEKNPTWETLKRLSEALDIEFLSCYRASQEEVAGERERAQGCGGCPGHGRRSHPHRSSLRLRYARSTEDIWNPAASRR